MKEYEHLLTEINKIIIQYLGENQSDSTKVINYHNAKELLDKTNLSLPSDRQDFENVVSKIHDYLSYSVRTTHPLFNNQLNGGFNPIALISDIITHLTNTSMATYEIAPMATLIELKLIERLGELIGYSESEGIMVTGGSNANMMAIHCARSNYSADTREKGNQSTFAVFVSDQAHYSFKKAVIVLGIGTDNLYLVDSDDKGRMKPESLKAQIQKAKEEGKTPLLVGSTAGTTVWGSFDPIEQIQKIADDEKLWHHIDGAWGAPCLFSDELKVKLKGCEKADSFTWDSHKLMGTGLITSFFLTRKKGILIQANSGGGKKYLFHENENGEYDLGLGSLQCGRKVDNLKLWFSWQYLGDEGFKDLVEGQFDKANYFYNKIINNKNFKVLNKPEYLNLCFQVIPKDKDADLNQFNLDLRYKLIKSGKMMINYSSDDEKIFFRMVFANNQLKKSDIDFIIREIESYL